MRARGFTLIESVLVIVILAFASVAVLTQFSQATRAWFVDEDLQTATQLAQERAEGILATRRNGTFADVAVGVTNDTLAGPYVAFARTVTVTAHAGAPCPAVNCKQVVVAVSRGGTPLAEVTLLLAEY